MKKSLFNFIHSVKTRTTFKRQLRVLLFGVVLPFVVMVAVILGLFYSFNREYAVTLQNASIMSQFNFGFKDKLDLDMYHYAVHSREMDHLPLEDVEEAQALISSLQSTTTLKDNQWRVKSLLRLCDQLTKYMHKLSDTDSYDQRVQMLDDYIYSITALIQSYMHDYIYDEVKALSTLQQDINARVTAAVAVAAAVSVMLIVFTLWYSTRLARGITQPIGQLCEKAKRIGGGDFTVVPIGTRNGEIKTLDDGFNEMVGRVNALMEQEKASQSALRRTELALLQAQINPHFLYNTFDSIIWLAEAHKDADVVKMTTNLSTFFRNSLSKGRDIIPLETEKQQVESYLEIQQIRYQDILTYSIRIPDGLLRYLIPKLTLQPLVENAIYHGIKNKRGGGKIVVTGLEEGGDILLTVADNGSGMTEEQLGRLRRGEADDRRPGGLGLANVEQRLKLYYGEGYGLSFDSLPGRGTEVTVRIPRSAFPPDPEKQNQLFP